MNLRRNTLFSQHAFRGCEVPYPLLYRSGWVVSMEDQVDRRSLLVGLLRVAGTAALASLLPEASRRPWSIRTTAALTNRMPPDLK